MFCDELSAPKPWLVIPYLSLNGDQVLGSKAPKMVPGLPHRYVIWIDGAAEVTNPSFAREALESINESGMATWKHPRRDCIYQEARASLGRESQGGRYASLPIKAQMDSYRELGHPEHWGLWACGTVAWDQEADNGLGGAWLAECERWGHQDQLSLPAVARRLGLRPGTFPYPQLPKKHHNPFYFENRWLRFHPHAPTSGVGWPD